MKKDVSDDKSNTNWIVLIIVTLITNLGTFSGSYIASKDTSNRLDLDRLEQSEQRISKIQKENMLFRATLLAENSKYKAEAEKYMKKNFLLSLENFDLKLKLKEEHDRRKLLQGFMDSLPMSAWAKGKNKEGTFVMEMINDAYVINYKITKKRYEGFTDYDIHPYELAKSYEVNDNAVLEGNMPVTVKEDIVVDGRTIPLVVWKFPFELEDGKVGVGGISLSTERLRAMLTSEKGIKELLPNVNSDHEVETLNDDK